MTEPNLINIPIDTGSAPDFNTRLGNPRLINMFVGESSYLYPTPGLNQIETQTPFGGVRSIHYTSFKGGSYIVVTNNAVLRISPSGLYSLVAQIVDSGLPVKIAENVQNQIIIVDGIAGYCYDQNKAAFVKLGAEHGFNLKSPVSVVVINTIAIILDKETDGWIISEANNALSYPVLENVPKIQSQLTIPIGLDTLNNNLYIFGSTGIERWVPNDETNPYGFPFARDNNYREDIGAINARAITRMLDKNGVSRIGFLSSQNIPMIYDGNSLRPMAEKASIGISKEISTYRDLKKCLVSSYTYRGNYFCNFTFPETKIAWIYNLNTDTFSISDDLMVDAVWDNAETEVIALSNGIFKLTTTPSYKKRTLISQRLVNDKSNTPFRNRLSSVELKIVQGYLQNREPQQIELTLSLDSQSWTNTVPRIIGVTGLRNARTVWSMNVTAPEFTFKWEFYGDLDFTIEKATATIS